MKPLAALFCLPSLGHVGMLLFCSLALTGRGSAEPVIMAGLNPVTAVPGQSAVLSVQASGTAPLTYEWRRNGLPVAGAAAASHTIPAVDEASAGVWAVKVTDASGQSVFSFCRVANPGAVLQWSNGQFPQDAVIAGGAVPVALSDGDTTMAISSTGGLLWTDDGSEYGRWPQAVLGAAPLDSQPTDLGTVVQLATHGHRIVALQADGAVRAWTRSRVDASPAPLGTWSHAPISLPLDAQRGQWVFMDDECVFVVRWDGTLAVVGPGANPLKAVPIGLTNVVQVMSGTVANYQSPSESKRHAVALRADGTVAAWGDNTYGQTEVPAGLSGVKQIAASSSWTVALKQAGSLVQWKAPEDPPVSQTGSTPGTLLEPTPITMPVSLFPPSPLPAGVFRSLRAGSGLLCAITSSGRPVVWSQFGGSLFVGASIDPLPPAVAEVVDFGNRWNGTTSRGFITALCRAAAPVITYEPEGGVVFVGDAVTLSVEATGRPLPEYQWFKGTAEVPEATMAELRLSSFTTADAASYTVRVRNLHGEVTSSPAVLSLANGPTITTQPQNAALRPGASTTLSVAATGSGTLTCRWLKNGQEIAGAVSSSLVIASGLPVDAGLYQVEVTDATGVRRSRQVRVGEGCSATGWHDGAEVSYLEGVQYSPGDVFLALSEGEGWLGIGADGKLGWFYERSSGSSFTGYAPSPMSFPTSSSDFYVAAAARERLAVAMDRDGGVTAWESSTMQHCISSMAVGSNSMSCSPGASYRPLPVPAAAQGAVAVSLSSGEEALALRADGRVIGWNARWSTRSSVPSALNADVTAISSGKDHHLALKADGSVIAWGDNTEGECAVPVGLINVKGIAALENVSFAILADGSVTAWGDNSLGQTTPPAGLSGVANLRGARGTVLATKGDGTLAVWGTGAASALPATISSVRSAAVMPVDPPPLGAIFWGGGRSLTSYGVALVPAAAPVISAWAHTLRVFPGFSGEIASAYARSFSGASLSGAWLKDGAPINSTVTTGSSFRLDLSNVTSADAGDYRVACDNGWQTGCSNILRLEVVSPRLFNAWKSAHFTASEIAAGLAAPDADPGGFGVTNLMRYTLGLDARNPQSSGSPTITFTPSESFSSGGLAIIIPSALTLSFEVPQDTADVGIFLESSPDLTTWTRTFHTPQAGELRNGRRQVRFNAPGPIAAPAPGNSVPAGAPANPLFYRIAIEPATPSLLPRF